MRQRLTRSLFPEPGTDPGRSAKPAVLRVRPASPPPQGPDQQAALALEPHELWVAIHLPHLPALAARAERVPVLPLIMLDGEDRNQRVVDLDAAAEAAGVRLGMTLGAALAAAPHIDARACDLAREQTLLRKLADVAAGFTPLVSLEPPDGLLLEIKPSIRLFGGLRELCARLRRACLDVLPFAGDIKPVFTLAPTPLAALAAARAGARCFVTQVNALPARLKPLPVTVLRWPVEQNARLAAMGVRTLGELMRLPRAGFAQRFGPAELADLDRLLGRRFDPRRRVMRRERYSGKCDLDHEVDSQAELLQALTPLLAELGEFLRRRQRGITALRCRFQHRSAEPTICTLRLAAAEADIARLTVLLGERLATITLPEPVRACELRGNTLVERPLQSKALWSAGERGHVPSGETFALVEQLRARLGSEAVYGLKRVSEHRPEHAWRVAEPRLDTAARKQASADVPARLAPFRRPIWLLHQPRELSQRRGRPQHHGALQLLEGPERIESGWWDGDDIERDYYLARDTRGAHLWVYRECGSARRWFLHGIFG